MAIRMMTSKEKYESGAPNIVKVSNYPGHEEGMIRHTHKCVHGTTADAGGGARYLRSEIRPEGLRPECVKDGSFSDRCDGPFGALYMETTHVGLVLELREYNGYDDSDFYAVVWNPETQATESVYYATTRGWSYPNGASVDATPEVLAAYKAYQERLYAERMERERIARLERAVVEAKTPAKGRRVKVVKGRKTPIGFSGVVIWHGTDNYGKARIGIKCETTGKVEFTAASNAVVDGWEYFLPSDHPDYKAAGAR